MSASFCNGHFPLDILAGFLRTSSLCLQSLRGYLSGSPSVSPMPWTSGGDEADSFREGQNKDLRNLQTPYIHLSLFKCRGSGSSYSRSHSPFNYHPTQAVFIVQSMSVRKGKRAISTVKTLPFSETAQSPWGHLRVPSCWAMALPAAYGLPYGGQGP